MNLRRILAALKICACILAVDLMASTTIAGHNNVDVDVFVNPQTGSVTIDYKDGEYTSALLEASFPNVFYGEADWDTPGGDAKNLPEEVSYTVTSGVLSGIDELGRIVNLDALDGADPCLAFSAGFHQVGAEKMGAGNQIICIPEPSTWMLFSLGAMAVAGFTRRYNR